MEATHWLVVTAGIAAIAWVNWYFLIAGRRGSVAAAVAGAAGRQDIAITVEGGYTPATVHVAAGRPVRLTFDRRESSGCSEEVVFPDFALRRYLPANERTVIDITPPAPGTYAFTCGMGMLQGRLIAE